MFCMHCGKEIENVGKFCEFCGNEIPAQSPSEVTVQPGTNIEQVTRKKKGSKLAIILTAIITSLLLGTLLHTRGYVADIFDIGPGIKQIIIVADKESIIAGEATNLKAKAILIDNSEMNLTDKMEWISEKPDIARVTQNGEVTGLNSGSCTIQLIYNDYLSEIEITVNEANQ